MTCSLRVSVYADETSTEENLLWLGDACVHCRKPLGFDGVVLVCHAHGTRPAFHSIHKTCLDGKSLEPIPRDARRILPLHEVLQLGLFEE